MKNNQSTNKSPIGNTLDYYNDDMSRKAVGKLFDDLDEFSPSDEDLAVGQDTSSIVVGYDDAPPTAAREHVYTPQPVEQPHDPAMERALERAAEIAEDGHRSAAKKPDERERGTRSRVFADEDYDMSIYRRGPVLINDEEYEELMRPRKHARRVESHPEPAVIRRSDPRDDQPRSRPRKPDADAYIERSRVRRDREDMAKVVGAYRRTRSLMPYILGTFMVLMIAIAMLIFRANSLNTRLKEAEDARESLTVEITNLQSLKLRNDALEKETSDLKAELQQLRDQADPGADGQDAPASGANQPPAIVEPELPTRYVVVEGDNLSKISNKFYGTPNNYEHIKSANGMTSDTVAVGQTLTIPKL